MHIEMKLKLQGGPKK